MSLINDYYYQTLTDQRERELEGVATHYEQVLLALSGQESWLRRLLNRRGHRRIAIAAPQHRVAH